MPGPLGFAVAGAAVEGGRRALGWAAGKLGVAAAAGQGIAGNTPILEDEVTVEVVGQPGANKNELYFLALAAANGVVRRFGSIIQLNPAAPPNYALLMIEYDAADHWVRCTIAYKTGMASIAAGTLSTPVGRLGFDRFAVYRGPQCEVVGGNFDFVDQTLLLSTGIPNTPAPTSGAPQLPFQGQTILTSCPRSPLPAPTPMTQAPPPSQPLRNPGPAGPTVNPKPPGDNRSRGVAVVPGASENAPNGQCCPKSTQLIPLVFAALTDPGSFGRELFTPPTSGPTGS